MLGLGLGLAITAFSLINGIFLTAPQVDSGRELLHVQWASTEQQKKFHPGMSGRELDMLFKQIGSFEPLAAYRNADMSLHNSQRDTFAKRYPGAKVTADFFKLFKTNPAIGRVFTQHDFSSKAGDIVVISDVIWREQFASSPTVIGSSVLLSGIPHTVVGVMPADYHFPANHDLWVKLGRSGNPRNRGVKLIGLLKEGRSISQANTELEHMADKLLRLYPETNKGYQKFSIEPLRSHYIGSKTRSILHIFTAIALLVFIIACANVSNIIMVRIAKRQHELAVRRALGATRGDIISQVLLEGLVFSIGGLLVGLVVYAVSGYYIWLIVERSTKVFPHWWNMNLNWEVWLFSLLAVILSTVTSSLVPALRAVTEKFAISLNDDARTASGLFIGRLARSLVSLQILCSTVLLIMVLMVMYISYYLVDRKLPFDPNQILTVSLQLQNSAGFHSDDAVAKFFDTATAKLKALPGVESVGFSLNGGGISQRRRQIEVGKRTAMFQEAALHASANIVTTGFFDVFDIKPLQGRLLLETDIKSSQRVVLINEYFLAAYFQNENPIGRSIRVRSLGRFGDISNLRRKSPWSDWMMIVGVIPNIQRRLFPRERPSELAEIYAPAAQQYDRSMSLLLKAKGDVKKWIEPARKIIHEIKPTLAPKSPYQTVQGFLDNRRSGVINLSRIIICFGVLALFISIVGLYTLVSFTTLLRRREFGIRSALGADTKRVLLLVFKRITWQLGLGLLLGIVVAIAANSILKESLGAQKLPVEVPSYLIGISIVVITSLVAVVIPALNAARRPPVQSLRVD